MANAKTIVGTTVVLHRQGNNIYYCDGKYMSYYNVHGAAVGLKEYTLCYVEHYRPETKEIQLLKDPQKIDKKAYSIWLSQHGKVWQEIEVQYIFFIN